ncbi:MAG: CRISPR-associated protein Cas4 [Chlorobiaceae bacterium]|nr:CRISPR-associated protein Cas4 [Chlorobiaceae bacterium]
MYLESEFIALSALQHYVYCPRQCALIHIEQVWAENSYTAEGREMHERVDDGETSYKPGIRITRSVPLRSVVLGASGIADVVEWHKRNDHEEPFPVEYKRGRQKKHDADKVQLCAQAICLEEMLGKTIPAGALFYGQTRHRFDVVFDTILRQKTIAVAEAVHELFRIGITPPPEPGPKCNQCSLQELCLPEIVVRSRSARNYVHTLFHELSEEEVL